MTLSVSYRNDLHEALQHMLSPACLYERRTWTASALMCEVDNRANVVFFRHTAILVTHRADWNIEGTPRVMMYCLDRPSGNRMVMEGAARETLIAARTPFFVMTQVAEMYGVYVRYGYKGLAAAKLGVLL